MSTTAGACTGVICPHCQTRILEHDCCESAVELLEALRKLRNATVSNSITTALMAEIDDLLFPDSAIQKAEAKP